MGSSFYKFFFYVVGTCLVGCVVISCQGHKQAPITPAQSQNGDSLGDSPAGFPVLPAPLDLPHSTSVPPSDGQRQNNGTSYDSNFPNENILDTGYLQFTSAWDPLAPVVTDLAYAGYVFPNMAGYTEDEGVRLSFDVPPTDYQNLYIALADFTLNGWRWFQVPDTDYVATPGFENFTNVTGDLFMMVLLAGTDTMDLDWLIIGDRLGVNVNLNSDLDPDPSQNVAPLTVNFNSSGWVYGGEVVSFDFDFEDDGVFEITGNLDGLESYEYTSPGSHTCRVRANDDLGRTGEEALTFWVVNQANTPPVAVLNANIANGPAPLSVTLDASGSTDDTGIIKYEWDLDEDGVFELDTGTTPTTNYIFGISGTHYAYVQVTDQDFATNEGSVTITLTSGFNHTVVANGYTLGDTIASYMVGIPPNQYPFVAWQDFPEQDLKCARATLKSGAGWNAEVDAAPAAEKLGYSPSIRASFTGRPVVVFGKEGADLKMDLQSVNATNDACTTWDGPYDIDVTSHAGYSNSLTMVNSVLCVVSVARPGGTYQPNTLYFYRATDPVGAGWDPAVKIFDSLIGVSLRGIDIHPAQLAIIQTPIASYCAVELSPTVFKVGVVPSPDPDGSTWGTPIEFTSTAAYSTSMLTLDNNPALVAGSTGQTSAMAFIRANTKEGDSWPPELTELRSGGYGSFADMKLVGGFPAVCYYSFVEGNLWYVTATDAQGSAWNEPFIVDSPGNVGEFCSMIVLEGDKPIIAYYDHTNRDIKVAYWTN